MPVHNKASRKPKSSRTRKRRLAQKQANALNFETLEARHLLASVTVGNTTDVLSPTADTSSISGLMANDGGDGISLREAITAANNTTGEDVITFDAGVFTGGVNSVIRLTQGELVIDESLRIDGSSATDILITGDAGGDDATLPGTYITDVSASGRQSLDGNSRVLSFRGEYGGVHSNLTLSGLIITGGRTTTNNANGGGISVSSGNLILTDSTVSGNSTSGNHGGGIYASSGTVSLTNSTVSGNHSRSGGGISTNSFSKLSLINSTVSGNTSFQEGGGIRVKTGSVSLTNSTVTNNFSYHAGGGGIHFYDYNGHDITLHNSVVAGNGDNGAGPDLLIVNRGQIIENSLVGDTTGSGILPTTGTGNILNQLALLGPLADNGGPTQTHALLEGSLAANAGSNALVNAGGLALDQRGEDRIQFGSVDIGAFESDFQVTRLVVTTNQDVEDSTDGVISLREAIEILTKKSRLIKSRLSQAYLTFKQPSTSPVSCLR